MTAGRSYQRNPASAHRVSRSCPPKTTRKYNGPNMQTQNVRYRRQRTRPTKTEGHTSSHIPFITTRHHGHKASATTSCQNHTQTIHAQRKPTTTTNTREMRDCARYLAAISTPHSLYSTIIHINAARKQACRHGTRPKTRTNRITHKTQFPHVTHHPTTLHQPPYSHRIPYIIILTIIP
jgi:hypothetical protein